MNNTYHNKYLKYKQKYQQLKNNKRGGAISSTSRFHIKDTIKVNKNM